MLADCDLPLSSASCCPLLFVLDAVVEGRLTRQRCSHDQDVLDSVSGLVEQLAQVLEDRALLGRGHPIQVIGFQHEVIAGMAIAVLRGQSSSCAPSPSNVISALAHLVGGLAVSNPRWPPKRTR